LANEMAPLKPNDEVYIRSIKTLGKVLRLLPDSTHDSEEQRFYEVQVTKYFLRSDLELDDTGAVHQKRQADLQQKTARLELARRNVEDALAAGGNVKPSTVTEFVVASNELCQGLRY